MKIIVLSKALKEAHIEKINKTAAGIGAETVFIKDESEIPEAFADAEILYGFGMNTAKTSRNLKWLCVPSAGVDYLMKPGSFANEDCILTNSSGAYGVTIAEHIIAVSLMMMRKLTVSYEETLRGEWGVPKPQKSLKDCRITALGTGDIGCSFAKRARAFEPASLVGVNRSGQCVEASFDRVVKIEELDTILPFTDLCVLSLPDTAETKDILSRKRMELLPKGAYIVNVGRGSAIDEDALADLLDSGHLAGAALDVFKTEPLPSDSRLWKTKNLLITPHLAGNLTLEHTVDRNVDLFCEDLINYANNRPLNNFVDRNKGY
ncbi:MAG: D-2-hydroxyacid dehydrogenase [Lachnospiraceae bacterium]|nr:D-2-hydroxyacid dehydrogenase [Lachnospiraceae bacterium]